MPFKYLEQMMEPIYREWLISKLPEPNSDLYWAKSELKSRGDHDNIIITTSDFEDIPYETYSTERLEQLYAFYLTLGPKT